MKHEIVLPKCGVSMDEGTIQVWHKKEGDQVLRGELLFELETDKVNVEIESAHEGYLAKILIKAGEKAAVGTVAAIITSERQELIAESFEQHVQVKQEQIAATLESQPARAESVVGRPRKFATPLARAKAQKLAIDITAVKGTGSGGVVVGQDIDNYVQTQERSMQKDEGSHGEKNRDVSVIPYQGMRKAIGEKMQHSMLEKPHFYLRSEVDADRLLALKELVFHDKGVKLSVSSILICLIARTLTRHPVINSRFCNGAIEVGSEINVGFAVGIDQGLIVPVIRNAQKKSLFEIHEETERLIAKAHNKTLASQDIEGGTITLSNLGMYDINEFTAIINPPESAIIAVGKIDSKLYFDTDRQVKEKRIMQITVSCDHRVIDGMVGAQFLSELKKIIEEPIRTLCY